MLGLLPLLSVVFIFLGSVYALGMEFKEGTASDLMSKAENNIFTALSGKMIPYTFLFFMNMLVMDLLMVKTLGTPLRGSLALILVSEILLIISYQLLAIFFTGKRLYYDGPHILRFYFSIDVNAINCQAVLLCFPIYKLASYFYESNTQGGTGY